MPPCVSIEVTRPPIRVRSGGRHDRSGAPDLSANTEESGAPLRCAPSLSELSHLLHFPPRFCQPLPHHLLRRLALGRVPLVVRPALSGGPLPDHEAAEARVAMP